MEEGRRKREERREQREEGSGNRREGRQVGIPGRGKTED